MARRLVTLLLFVGYLASQLAMVPHTHAGESVRHGVRPHIHGDSLLKWFGVAPSKHDGHGHSHHGHSHDHDHEPAGGSASSMSDEEHDSDCVYVPDVGGADTKVQGEKDLVASLDFEALPHLASDRETLPSLVRLALQAPPDIECRSCALIVKLRTLRI